MEKLYMEYLKQKGHVSQEVIKARDAYEEALENYVETVEEQEFYETTEFLQKRGGVEQHKANDADMHGIFCALDEISFKYERLTSLIGILQQFIAEQVEIAGAPEDSLANALYEIELGMDANNERLRGLFQKKGGAVE